MKGTISSKVYWVYRLICFFQGHKEGVIEWRAGVYIDRVSDKDNGIQMRFCKRCNKITTVDFTV